MSEPALHAGDDDDERGDVHGERGERPRPIELASADENGERDQLECEHGAAEEQRPSRARRARRRRDDRVRGAEGRPIGPAHHARELPDAAIECVRRHAAQEPGREARRRERRRVAYDRPFERIEQLQRRRPDRPGDAASQQSVAQTISSCSMRAASRNAFDGGSR